MKLKRNFILTLSTRAIKQQTNQNKLNEKEMNLCSHCRLFAENKTKIIKKSHRFISRLFDTQTNKTQKKLASFQVEFISRGVSGNLIIQLT
jgi:hypothetical protein